MSLRCRDVSVAAKFILASIAAVVNHAGPRSHPATSGGSNSCCPMFDSGPSALLSVNPAGPTSFSARATNSTGHEYLAK